MHVMGGWNWWAPRPLVRLHQRIGISESGPDDDADADADAEGDGDTTEPKSGRPMVAVADTG
jgi:RND superfamily putative drug exporter